jgi:hypothetical protein
MRTRLPWLPTRKPDVEFTINLPTYDTAPEATRAMGLFARLCTYTEVMPVVREGAPDGTITVRGRPKAVEKFRTGYTLFHHRGVI